MALDVFSNVNRKEEKPLRHIWARLSLSCNVRDSLRQARRKARIMTFAGMLRDQDIQSAVQACQGESSRQTWKGLHALIGIVHIYISKLTNNTN